MNIFFLDTDPKEAAVMQCDKHVSKMAVESVQMLVSALRRHGATDADVPLTKAGTPHRGGHPNHPSTVWAGDASGNFHWLAHHAVELCREYTFRYGKVHACESQALLCAELGWDLIPYGARTDVPLCVGEDFHELYGTRSSFWAAPGAYRHFYRATKSGFARWERGRSAPVWW